MKFTKAIYSCILKTWSITPFKKSILDLTKVFNFRLKKIKSDLWFSGEFKVKFHDSSFKLYASKDDRSSMSIYWSGLEWDRVSLDIWAKLSKKAEVILDVGANIGLYCLIAKTINKNADVHSFEPSRKIQKILSKNIEINKLTIHLHKQALSNFSGEIELYDLNTPTAIASLKPNENLINSTDIVSYPVEVTTADSFVIDNNIKKIDLISIDVEMNEPEVLEGMKNIIETSKPDFIIEVLNNEIGAKIQEIFINTDYLFFSINEKTGLIKKDKIFRNEDEIMDHNFNFLICKESSAKYLELTQ